MAPEADSCRPIYPLSTSLSQSASRESEKSGLGRILNRYIVQPNFGDLLRVREAKLLSRLRLSIGLSLFKAKSDEGFEN